MDISYGSENLLKELETVLHALIPTARPEAQELLVAASFLRRFSEACEGEGKDFRALTLAHEAAVLLRECTTLDGGGIDREAVLQMMVRSALVAREYDVALRLLGHAVVSREEGVAEGGGEFAGILGYSGGAEAIFDPQDVVCGDIWRGFFPGMQFVEPAFSTLAHVTMGGFVQEGKFNVALLKRAVTHAMSQIDHDVGVRSPWQSLHHYAQLQPVRPCVLRLDDTRTLLASRGLIESTDSRSFLEAVGLYVCGQAWRASAALAAQSAVFPRYRSFEPLVLRALGKMRDAAYALAGAGIPESFRDEMRKVWDSVLEEVMAHGARNMVFCVVAAPAAVLSSETPCPQPPPSPPFLLAERNAVVHDFMVGGVPCTVIVSVSPDGQPCDLRLQAGATGGTMQGLFEAMGRISSLALQAGLPLSSLAAALRSTCFPPLGPTSSTDLPYALSIADYLGQWLERRFLKAPK